MLLRKKNKNVRIEEYLMGMLIRRGGGMPFVGGRPTGVRDVSSFQRRGPADTALGVPRRPTFAPGNAISHGQSHCRVIRTSLYTCTCYTVCIYTNGSVRRQIEWPPCVGQVMTLQAIFRNLETADSSLFH